MKHRTQNVEHRVRTGLRRPKGRKSRKIPYSLFALRPLLSCFSFGPLLSFHLLLLCLFFHSDCFVPFVCRTMIDADVGRWWIKFSSLPSILCSISCVPHSCYLIFFLWYSLSYWKPLRNGLIYLHVIGFVITTTVSIPITITTTINATATTTALVTKNTHILYL